MAINVMKPCTVEDLKSLLISSSEAAATAASDKVDDCASGQNQANIVLDIDETLAATNVAWFERCVQLFGNPEKDLDVPKLIQKYHLAQYNPAWQSQDAQDWMHEQRTAPEAQDNLPLIPGAVEGVNALLRLNNNKNHHNDNDSSDDTRPTTNDVVVNIVGYLTVRPASVHVNTMKWLKGNGFPDRPVVSKPDSSAFEVGTRWKAQALHTLFPFVSGIVDDNPKVAKFVGSHYQGKVYLFGKGREDIENDFQWAIPCKTWKDVVRNVQRCEESKYALPN